MTAQWANPDQTIGNLIGQDGTITQVTVGSAGWLQFLCDDDGGEIGSRKIEPYAPPAAPDPMEAERSLMVASRFQVMAALHGAGLLAAAEKAMLTGDYLVQLAWANAGDFRRHSVTIDALAVALKLSEAQVDELFRAAAAIDV